MSLDGDVGAQVLSGFDARGLVGLAIYDSGARCFYNTQRPIHAPADLHGLKLRVPPSDIFMRADPRFRRQSDAIGAMARYFPRCRRT